MSKKLGYVLSFAAVLSLFIAGGLVFAAGSGSGGTGGSGGGSNHPKPHGPHALMVTLDSASGTTLTVTARGSESAITTIDASSAKIIVKGVTSTVGGLKDGDRLIVLGTISGSTVTATRITDGAGANSGPSILTGSVTAVSGNTITVSVTQHVRGGKGTKGSPSTTSVTVTTDAKTLFNVPGIKGGTISNVTVGSRIMVIGVDPTTGTGTARLVSVMPAVHSHGAH